MARTRSKEKAFTGTEAGGTQCVENVWTLAMLADSWQAVRTLVYSQ